MPTILINANMSVADTNCNHGSSKNQLDEDFKQDVNSIVTKLLSKSDSMDSFLIKYDIDDLLLKKNKVNKSNETDENVTSKPIINNCICSRLASLFDGILLNSNESNEQDSNNKTNNSNEQIDLIYNEVKFLKKSQSDLSSKLDLILNKILTRNIKQPNESIESFNKQGTNGQLKRTTSINSSTTNNNNNNNNNNSNVTSNIKQPSSNSISLTGAKKRKFNKIISENNQELASGFEFENERFEDVEQNQQQQNRRQSEEEENVIEYYKNQDGVELTKVGVDEETNNVERNCLSRVSTASSSKFSSNSSDDKTDIKKTNQEGETDEEEQMVNELAEGTEHDEIDFINQNEEEFDDDVNVDVDDECGGEDELFLNNDKKKQSDEDALLDVGCSGDDELVEISNSEQPIIDRKSMMSPAQTGTISIANIQSELNNGNNNININKHTKPITTAPAAHNFNNGGSAVLRQGNMPNNAYQQQQALRSQQVIKQTNFHQNSFHSQQQQQQQQQRSSLSQVNNYGRVIHLNSNRNNFNQSRQFSPVNAANHSNSHSHPPPHSQHVQHHHLNRQVNNVPFNGNNSQAVSGAPGAYNANYSNRNMKNESNYYYKDSQQHQFAPKTEFSSPSSYNGQYGNKQSHSNISGINNINNNAIKTGGVSVMNNSINRTSQLDNYDSNYESPNGYGTNGSGSYAKQGSQQHPNSDIDINELFKGDGPKFLQLDTYKNFKPPIVTINDMQYIDEALSASAYSKSKSRRNYAAHLAKLVFTPRERLESNCNGRFGKKALDATRLMAIRNTLFKFYPCKQSMVVVNGDTITSGDYDENTVWVRDCIPAIDESNRVLKKQLIAWYRKNKQQANCKTSPNTSSSMHSSGNPNSSDYYNNGELNYSNFDDQLDDEFELQI